MSALQIKNITAHEILASSGYPTLEVAVELSNGVVGRASVPYGASAGSHEAVTLFDEDARRYGGKGMLRAVQHVQHVIAPVIEGKKLTQRQLDAQLLDLDGTRDKSSLGGNAILAVSLAAARAGSAAANQELYEWLVSEYELAEPSTLPGPMMVAIEGGKHASNSTDLQEYCLTGLGTGSVVERVRKTIETYHQLRSVLSATGLSTNVGNEGAFAPEGIHTNQAPLDYLVEAISVAGYQPGDDVAISIDAAANEFFSDGSYRLKLEGQQYSAEQLIEYYTPWLSQYPIITIEDMLHEDDWEAWSALKQIADQQGVTVVGDDLTVTAADRLQQALDSRAISAILLKLNQAGTLTETIETCQLAQRHNLMMIPSHRGGGETNDTFMVDLAVAVGAEYIKVGPTRGERVSKYNRLMEIERLLG